LTDECHSMCTILRRARSCTCRQRDSGSCRAVWSSPTFRDSQELRRPSTASRGPALRAQRTCRCPSRRSSPAADIRRTAECRVSATWASHWAGSCRTTDESVSVETGRSSCHRRHTHNSKTSPEISITPNWTFSMPPTVEKAISVAFVRPSVCLSVRRE